MNKIYIKQSYSKVYKHLCLHLNHLSKPTEFKKTIPISELKYLLVGSARFTSRLIQKLRYFF